MMPFVPGMPSDFLFQRLPVQHRDVWVASVCHSTTWSNAKTWYGCEWYIRRIHVGLSTVNRLEGTHITGMHSHFAISIPCQSISLLILFFCHRAEKPGPMDLGNNKETTSLNTGPTNRLASSEDKVATSTTAASNKMVAASAASSASVCTYRDHARYTDDDEGLKELLKKADSEGVKGTDQSFPVKLHQLLSESDEDGFSSIVSWQSHGRSFIVKKHTEFVEKVLPW